MSAGLEALMDAEPLELEWADRGVFITRSRSDGISIVSLIVASLPRERTGLDETLAPIRRRRP